MAVRGDKGAFLNTDGGEDCIFEDIAVAPAPAVNGPPLKKMKIDNARSGTVGTAATEEHGVVMTRVGRAPKSVPALRHIAEQAYLGGAYFVPKSMVSLGDVREELFVSKKALMGMGGAKQPMIEYKLYDDNDPHYFALPKFYGLSKYGSVPTANNHTLLSTRKQLCPDRTHFAGTLVTTPVQQTVGVETMLEHLRNPEKHNGGYLVCPCGGGKTVMGSYMWANLGLLGVIVVQDGGIARQWVDTLRVFCPNARVGIIQGKRNDLMTRDGRLADVDVVIAMAQTLASSSRTIPPHIMSAIGTLIVDEMHHSAAETRALALRKIPATYTIGVTATPYRNDGLTYALSWLLGPCVVVLEKEAMPCTVQMLDYRSSLDLRDRNNNPLWNKMYEMIVANTERNNLIIERLADLLEDEPTRRVIVWSKRVAHLELLNTLFIQEMQRRYGTTNFQRATELPKTHAFVSSNASSTTSTTTASDEDILPLEDTLDMSLHPSSAANGTAASTKTQKKGGKRSNPKWDAVTYYDCSDPDPAKKKFVVSCGWYIGDASAAQQDDAKRAQIMWGANLCQEGMNDPSRDTLFVTMPHGKDINQLSGRLQRIYPDKNPLLILHVHDRYSVFEHMGWGCYKSYRKLDKMDVSREDL